MESNCDVDSNAVTLEAQKTAIDMAPNHNNHSDNAGTVPSIESGNALTTLSVRGEETTESLSDLVSEPLATLEAGDTTNGVDKMEAITTSDSGNPASSSAIVPVFVSISTTALSLAAAADETCTWDMPSFKFPIALRNENVKKLPWIGTPSLGWTAILAILNTRYPSRGFQPKDPRVRDDIWAMRVARQNRTACFKIFVNVATVYQKARRAGAAKCPTTDDELTSLMDSMSLQASAKVPKLPWLSEHADPIWAGLVITFDVLYATDPSKNPTYLEMRMNHMRVAKHAVALLRSADPTLTPDREPHPTASVQGFLALSKVLIPAPSSSESTVANIGAKRKQDDTCMDVEDDAEVNALADNRIDTEADDESDDEDVPCYNLRLKRARID